LLLTLLEYAQVKQLLVQCSQVPKILKTGKLGSLYLAHLFGAKPMADVVKELYKRLTGLDRRLREYEDGENKLHTSHAYKSFRFGNTEVPRYTMNCPISGRLCRMGYGVKVRQTIRLGFHYVCRYSYSIDPILKRKALSGVGRMLHAFGSLGPAAVWDAIPFTWLLNWFLPAVQPALARMPDLITPYEAIRLNMQGTALVIRRTGTEQVMQNNICFSDSWPETVVTKHSKEIYRFVGNQAADVLNALEEEARKYVSIPTSLSQIAIIAALLHG
jgi:hypothetical protein